MRKARPAELVMGSVQLGLPYGAANRTGKPTRSAACRLVARAVDAGITKFDTARAYGDAEERLGEALRARKAVRTITKLSPLSELAPGASRRDVRAAVDASIEDPPLRARARAYGLSPAAPRRTHDRLRRRGVGAADRAAGRRHDPGARRVGAIRRRGAGRTRLRRCLPHPASLQPARLALGRKRRHRPGSASARTSPSTPAASFSRASSPPTIRRYGPASPAPMRPGRCRCSPASRRNSGAKASPISASPMSAGRTGSTGVVVGMETELQLDENIRLFVRPPLAAEDCARIAARIPRLPETLLNPALWPKSGT